MKREVIECDICGKPYDASREADEPMHRVGLSDPPPMDLAEEIRLDKELKTITAEAKKPGTTPEARIYYEERAAALHTEAEKRRAVSAGGRVDVDLICHACFLELREHAKHLQAVKG